MNLIKKFCILYVFAVCVFYSCKKDLGNYEYNNTQLPVIDTAGIGGTLSVLRFEHLKLNPKIAVQTGNTVSYQWLIYARSVSTSNIPVARVISNDLILDVEIPDPVGSYSLELIATDTKTDLKTNYVFSLNVSANVDYGMMVLYQNARGGDIDFLKSPAMSTTIKEKAHLKQLYSAVDGSYMPGNAKFIWSARQSFQNTNWVTVASDTYIARFQGSDFSFLRDQLDIFRSPNAVIKPEAYMYMQSSYQVLINNGKLHATNVVAYESDAKFGVPAFGDYQAAPFLSPKVGSPFYIVAYDQLHGRFLKYVTGTNTLVDFNAPANSDQLFDLRNVGKDMLYMTDGANDRTFSFFKDKTGAGRWLYEANFTATSDNGMLATGKYEMTALPDIDQARLYQVSRLGSFVYYATNNKIYNYSYKSTNTAVKAFDVPAGEEITSLKIYRPSPNYLVSDKEERTLYVATWNGTIGKVYELSINETSGVINPTPLNVFEISGKIADMATRAKGNG